MGDVRPYQPTLDVQVDRGQLTGRAPHARVECVFEFGDDLLGVQQRDVRSVAVAGPDRDLGVVEVSQQAVVQQHEHPGRGENSALGAEA